MASQEVGIKETRELVLAAFAVAVVIIKPLKDGFQAGKDVQAILAGLLEDPGLSVAVKTAIEGANHVPAELNDIGLFEGLEFAKLLLAEGKKLAAVLQAA